MKTNLKNSLSTNKTLLILSIVTVLLGAISCVLGEIVTPFIAGVLSAIFLFDTKSKYAFSTAVSVVLVAINIASIVFGFAVTLFAPCAIILSLIISLSFKKGESKADAAYLMTVISAVLAVVGYMIFAMGEIGSYTFDAAVDYYKNIVNELRPIYVDGFYQIYAASGLEVTAETISELFDQQLKLIVSFLLIGGFITGGIAMKVFGAVVSRCAEDDEEIKNWRFSASRLYAYFYVILIILSLFTTSSTDLFSVCVLNLYNIFLVVFAYIGFNVALDMLKKRTRRPVISTVLLIGVMIIFMSFALQILAALGTLHSMKRNGEITDNK